jgi:hypothetical protein
MHIDDLIEVLRAAKEGKALQSRDSDGGSEWRDELPYTFPLVHREWRIKPQPREWFAYVDQWGNLVSRTEPAFGPVSARQLKEIRVREVL